MHPSSAEKISLLLFLCFQSRPFFPPPPYQVLVHGQGEGREEGRLWDDFGEMGAWVFLGTDMLASSRKIYFSDKVSISSHAMEV